MYHLSFHSLYTKGLSPNGELSESLKKLQSRTRPRFFQSFQSFWKATWDREEVIMEILPTFIPSIAGPATVWSLSTTSATRRSLFTKPWRNRTKRTCIHGSDTPWSSDTLSQRHSLTSSQMRICTYSPWQVSLKKPQSTKWSRHGVLQSPLASCRRMWALMPHSKQKGARIQSYRGSSLLRLKWRPSTTARRWNLHLLGQSDDCGTIL